MKIAAIGRLALSAVAVLLGGSAQAEVFDYNCDTAAGSFSQIKVVQTKSEFRVRGSITPVSGREHEQWRPTAGVTFTAADKNWLSIRLSPHEENQMVVLAQWTSEGKKFAAKLGIVEMGKAVPFQISVPTSGNAIIEALGSQHSVERRMGGSATLTISCSTGEFQFDQIDWGS